MINNNVNDMIVNVDEMIIDNDNNINNDNEDDDDGG